MYSFLIELGTLSTGEASVSLLVCAQANPPYTHTPAVPVCTLVLTEPFRCQAKERGLENILEFTYLILFFSSIYFYSLEANYFTVL